jgi:DeoR family transcriptional regulator, fructose operon transcriptional repressor
MAVPDLCSDLSVSEATVRRDLQHLADLGQVQRVRGGAVAVAPTGAERPEPLHREKVRLHPSEKRAIARVAAAQVAPGMVVALDSGSTMLALALALRDRHPSTVITTDLNVAIALADSPAIDVVLIGGSVRVGLYNTIGPLALATLAELHAQIAFLGADAIDTDRGVTNANLSEVAVKRALLRCARRRILLADHTKFDRVSLSEVAPLAGFDELITDARLDGRSIERYRAAGAALTVAPLEESS